MPSERIGTRCRRRFRLATDVRVIGSGVVPPSRATGPSIRGNQLVKGQIIRAARTWRQPEAAFLILSGRRFKVCHFPPTAFFGVGCVLRLEAEATHFAEDLAAR